jgi:tripartite-type tricarboxylate transporter receptor subunit TctC
MKGHMKGALIIIVILGAWIFLSQGMGFSEVKDPDYPTKSISFIIPWPAGGGTDTVTRPLIEAAGKFLGQPMIPINKVGGASIVGSVAVMNAKPDGYTLGVGIASSILIIPHTEGCPYKDLNGFTLMMNYTKYIFPLVVRNDAPWKTWKEFIEWARQNPGAAKIGITGGRSQSPMGIALWQAENKEHVRFTYIVLKGTGENLSALLGGHTTMSASALDPSAMAYIKEGKLRILAFMSKEKATGFESIPSFQDLYGFAPPNLMGVWGPKGLPEHVLKKLDEAFANAVKDTDFIKVANRTLYPVVYLDRAEINREVRDMFPKVGKIIESLRVEEMKEK